MRQGRFVAEVAVLLVAVRRPPREEQRRRGVRASLSLSDVTLVFLTRYDSGKSGSFKRIVSRQGVGCEGLG